ARPVWTGAPSRCRLAAIVPSARSGRVTAAKPVEEDALMLDVSREAHFQCLMSRAREVEVSGIPVPRQLLEARSDVLRILS
ncbi:MAG: hypothetical protein M1823_008999, partial [Watsoniomyces obsoletus]